MERTALTWPNRPALICTLVFVAVLSGVSQASVKRRYVNATGYEMRVVLRSVHSRSVLSSGVLKKGEKWAVSLSDPEYSFEIRYGKGAGWGTARLGRRKIRHHIPDLVHIFTRTRKPVRYDPKEKVILEFVPENPADYATVSHDSNQAIPTVREMDILTIHNDAKSTVQFSVFFGRGNERKFSISPGSYHFFFAPRGQNYHTIMYDRAPAQKGYQRNKYRLDSRTNWLSDAYEPDAEQGEQYYFDSAANGEFEFWHTN